MEDTTPLLLDLWREVSRQYRINQSADRMFSLLREPLNLERLAIRGIDAARGRLETVVLLGPAAEEGEQMIEGAVAEWSRLLACCSDSRLLGGAAGELEERYPGLLPPGMTGMLLVGGLVMEGTASNCPFFPLKEKGRQVQMFLDANQIRVAPECR
ncbi:MAG: hypothetical protein P8178_09520, partial [Candidatus Thiodiazotropha sp.]